MNDPIINKYEEYWNGAKQVTGAASMQLEQALLEESDLLSAKLKCLELANAMWRTPENTPITADLIVSDAQKFWDFLTSSIAAGSEAQSETSA